MLRRVVTESIALPVVVISDRTVFELYGRRVLTSLGSAGFAHSEFLLDPGERSKTLSNAAQIYDFLADRRVLRDGIILALGGGVVSDVAGFAASTWMRGIRFAICPTTLEADVDASLGGKTGVNLGGGKNLVGTFHQPILVAVDPSCLQSLGARDVRAGLAESVKHASITSVEFLQWHETNTASILALEPDVLVELVQRNLRIKGEIVEADAFEKTGRRAMLNFGHTIGHAIEATCDFDLRHGECVSLGMIAACRLSRDMGMLGAADVERVESLLGGFGLPTKLPERLDPDQVIRAIELDKKRRVDGIRFVLLEQIGHPVIHTVPEQTVRRAFESLTR